MSNAVRFMGEIISEGVREDNRPGGTGIEDENEDDNEDDMRRW